MKTASVVDAYDNCDYGQPEFYDASGNLLNVTTSQFRNPFLFSGREWDPELAGTGKWEVAVGHPPGVRY